MKKSIEEMIKSGCTYEEAMDALQDVWDNTVSEREYVMKEAEARQNLLKDYEKYLIIVYPDITSTDLEKNVAKLQETLIIVRDIYHKFNKISELQQKSKEENVEKSDNFEDWVERLFKKLDEERKDAETAVKDKIYKQKPNPQKTENTSLDDFLRKMGW